MDRRHTPRPLSQALRRPGSVLSDLRQEAERLRKLETRLLPLLPATLRAHCRVARVDAGAMVLMTDSPVWSSRLRFLEKVLLDAAAAETGCRPRRLRILISRPAPVAQETKPRRLSKRAGQHLESAARGQPDPALREALLRLSGRR